MEAPPFLNWQLHRGALLLPGTPPPPPRAHLPPSPPPVTCQQSTGTAALIFASSMLRNEQVTHGAKARSITEGLGSALPRTCSGPPRSKRFFGLGPTFSREQPRKEGKTERRREKQETVEAEQAEAGNPQRTIDWPRELVGLHP